MQMSWRGEGKGVEQRKKKRKTEDVGTFSPTERSPVLTSDTASSGRLLPGNEHNTPVDLQGSLEI